MDVHIYNKQKDLSISRKRVVAIANEVVSLEGKSYDEVAIHFVTQKGICKIHLDYMEDPSPTDCISFPMDAPDEEGYRMLGDVFVCPHTALEYAAKHGKCPAEETTLYLVHGLLHLLGYDDINLEDRKKMRAAERRHMKNLHKIGSV